MTQNIRRLNGTNVNPNIPVNINNYRYQQHQFSQLNNSFGTVDKTRSSRNSFDPQNNQNNWIQPQNSNNWNHQPNQGSIPQQYLNNLSQQQNSPRLLNERTTKSAMKSRDNSSSHHRNVSLKIF